MNITTEFLLNKVPTESVTYFLSVLRYALESTYGVKVKVLEYGAGISDVVVPDKNGKLDHVILGFESLDGYKKFDYIGSTIGRVANRVKDGKFSLRGPSICQNPTYQLTVNDNGNHLHGGSKGWSTVTWAGCVQDDKVRFSHCSPNGSEGYPGDVFAQVHYSLEEEGRLVIEYEAISTTETTPINMTNHTFFNLAGHASGQEGLFEHEIQVFADSYLPVSSDLIPTGEIRKLGGSTLDVSRNRSLKEVILASPGMGLDHCFCLKDKQRGSLRLAAKFTHPPSGRSLKVFTTESAVQIYTGNYLPIKKRQMVGRDNVSYTYQGAFCCEPQNYPDAVNQENFPDSLVHRGQSYKHKIVYQFEVEK